MKYEELFLDANTLYTAYVNSCKGSKWKSTTQRFRLNFLRHLFKITEEIETRTLENGPTTEFLQWERGRIRPITSICLHDQIIRHVLCDEVFMPVVRKRIIYDNCASVKGRGISMQRKRFEIHLHRYFQEHGSNEGWILFGDFTKFYDNIIHEIAKRELLKLVDNDGFVEWLLGIIFEGFAIDVSYLSDGEYAHCYEDVFNSLDYREIPDGLKTGEKWMHKSVNIGDQLSQVIGIYYPYPVDNYIKTVRAVKYYGRYMDDFYIIARTKEELWDYLGNITAIASGLGININMKKTRIVKLSSTYKFLQIKYSLRNNGKVIKRINPKRVTDMRRKLKKMEVLAENGERTQEQVQQMFRSWMCDYYRLMSREQRNNMLALYEELFNTRITIRKSGKKNKMIFEPKEDNNGFKQG